MNRSELKYLLKETTDYVHSHFGYHPVKNGPELLSEDSAFSAYIDSLAQGLNPVDEKLFRESAQEIRKYLLEAAVSNSAFMPYNQLSLPLLRIFFPRLVAKEAVTVEPINAPYVVKYFLKAYAKTVVPSATKELPDLSGNLSLISTEVPSYTANNTQYPDVTLELTNNAFSGNLISYVFGTNTLSNTTGLQRPLKITKIMIGSEEYDVHFVTDTLTGNGIFAFTDSNANTYTININVNYATGDVSLNVTGGTIDSVNISFGVSLETNYNLTEVELKLEPYQISAVTRKLNVKYSIEFEQDVKALFDVDAQATYVDLVGAQIATDVDKEILLDLLVVANALNKNNTASFNKQVPTGFAFGPKIWYENITIPLSKISARVYQDTNISTANVIICNPIDLSIIQSTGLYVKTGDIVSGGEYGNAAYSVGTFNSQWKVLSTQLMPEGTMLVLLKPNDPSATVYYYAPYRPITLYPYPMTTVPSLTYMTRYGKTVVRPKGIASLKIVSGGTEGQSW